jgi:RHS repeat-associated protein
MESQSFTYDANGNRLALNETDNSNEVQTVYSILEKSNRLTKVDETECQYDANGNIINDGEHSYNYDARNRLTQVDTTNHYLYNANNMRVKKTTANGTTLYAWDNDRIFAEYDENGTPVQETVYFGSTPVALLKNGKTYRIFTDQATTPRVVSNSANKTVWEWDFDPFGKKQPANKNLDKVPFVYNARFPGQYYDTEMSLFYNYRRTYNPATGRYLESDPAGLDGGNNSYTYSSSNPVIFIDSNGLRYTKIIQPNNIIIRTSITVFGGGNIGWTQNNRWYRGIVNTWRKDPATGQPWRYSGTRLTSLMGKSISFQISMRYDSSATAHWNASPRAQNYVRIMGANTGAWVLNTWYGEWESNASGNVAAHEFGHILNLNDHYQQRGTGNSRVTRPCNNRFGDHTNHLMADLGSLVQHEINDVIDNVSSRPQGCPLQY